jgi:hypothetical protein
MAKIEGFETFELQVGRDGGFPHPQQRQHVLDFFGAPHAPDLWLVSHGWNNDLAEATDLYRRWLREVRIQWDARKAPHVTVQPAVVLLFWPSKKFADRDLIPGQAASLDSTGAASVLAEELDRLRGFFDHPDADALIDELQALLPKLTDSPMARKTFAEKIRDLPQIATTDPDDEEADSQFATLDGAKMMSRLEGVVSIDQGTGSGGSGGGAAAMSAGPSLPESLDGHAAGLFSLIGGALSAAYNALNLTTYYQMKKRAGILGCGPVAALLREIAGRNGSLRIHLTGHSFGARLCSAAVRGNPGMAPLTVQSLTLLQAAFSHHGFAPKEPDRDEGFFRGVLTGEQVRGPILATHSRHDIPVGLAYPLASRLVGDASAGIGDAKSRYGGLGRNGAQRTPGTQQQVLSKVGASYGFEAGAVTNLDADATIFGHSDICKPEVAYAFTCAADS